MKQLLHTKMKDIQSVILSICFLYLLSNRSPHLLPAVSQPLAQDRSHQQPHYPRPQLPGPGDRGHHPWRGPVTFNDSTSGSFDDAIELCFSLRKKRTTLIDVSRCSSVTLLLLSLIYFDQSVVVSQIAILE